MNLDLKAQFAGDRIQVAASGDLAYTCGRCKMTMKPAVSSGSYLTIWEKQADGGWKPVEDFVTPGPEAGQ